MKRSIDITRLLIAALLLFSASVVLAADEEKAPASPPEPAAEKRLTALSSTVHLLVNNPQEKRQVIQEKITGLGGFVVFMTDQQLRLKLPPGKLSEALTLAMAEGEVVDRTLERSDLTAFIADLQARLRTRQKVYTKLRAFFDQADVEGTAQIEREMNDLILEIEGLKGQLRVAQERASWALLEINFRFRQRDRIHCRTSPFEWLNTVSLGRLVREF